MVTLTNKTSKDMSAPNMRIVTFFTNGLYMKDLDNESGPYFLCIENAVFESDYSAATATDELLDEEDADVFANFELSTDHVEGLKQHAVDNYTIQGWDLVVECMTDRTLAFATQNCETLQDAIAYMIAENDIHVQVRAEHEAEADAGR